MASIFFIALPVAVAEGDTNNRSVPVNRNVEKFLRRKIPWEIVFRNPIRRRNSSEEQKSFFLCQYKFALILALSPLTASGRDGLIFPRPNELSGRGSLKNRFTISALVAVQSRAGNSAVPLSTEIRKFPGLFGHPLID
jgi:hypothetical protein